MHGATIHPIERWFVRLCLLLTLVGCSFKAAGVDGEVASVPDAADTGIGLEDTGVSPGDGETPPDPERTDDDLDGYTEAEGDCNDDDDTVRPGLPDSCDGVDNDCDDEIDEDARAEDPFEPNDSVAHELGDLDAVGSFEVDAFLHDEDDVDRFEFVYTDSLIDLDTLTVELTNFTGDITYKMKIVAVESEDEVFEGFSTPSDDALRFTLESGLGSDSATFRVTISSLGGADCTTPYRLNIVHSDWWGRP